MAKVITTLPVRWLVQVKKKSESKWIKLSQYVIKADKDIAMTDYVEAMNDCNKGKYYAVRLIRRIVMEDTFEHHSNE